MKGINVAKILVAEDDPVLNRAYQLILETEKHDVRTANDGEEALEIAEEFKPEIIFLDLLMPRMNGLEFLRRYDLKNQSPEIKLIVLSNLDGDKEVEEAMKLGAYKYLVKAHSSPEELAALVRHLVAKNLIKSKKQ